MFENYIAPKGGFPGFIIDVNDNSVCDGCNGIGGFTSFIECFAANIDSFMKLTSLTADTAKGAASPGADSGRDKIVGILCMAEDISIGSR